MSLLLEENQSAGVVNPLTKEDRAAHFAHFKSREDKVMRVRKRKAACAAFFLTICLAVFAVHYQLKPVATIVEVVEGTEPEQELVAEVTPPTPEFQQKMTVRLRMPLNEAREYYASQSVSYTQTKPQATKLASLQPVATSKSKQAPKPEVWTATLPERQEIAREYLEKVCRSILKLESAQSTADTQKTNARFMAAKNPKQVIGGVLRELQEHPNVVWTMCPTQFYEMLFAKK